MERDEIYLTFMKCVPMYMCISGANSLRSKEPIGTYYSTYITLGLGLSLLGDIALELEPLEPKLFIIGLVFFLLAHVFYIMAFRECPYIWSLETSFPFLLGISMYTFLLPNLPQDMLIPVGLYTLVISGMTSQAIARWSGCKAGQSQLHTVSLVEACGGSFIFLVSDATLAIGKYVEYIPWAKYAVMVTYFAAQSLIASSCENCINQPPPKPSTETTEHTQNTQHNLKNSTGRGKKKHKKIKNTNLAGNALELDESRESSSTEEVSQASGNANSKNKSTHAQPRGRSSQTNRKKKRKKI